MKSQSNAVKSLCYSLIEQPIFYQAKPIIKWAGGKKQLLPIISSKYPKELGKSINKYAEPFIGGGAVLFDILNKYKLDSVYISDINLELINMYQCIRSNPDDIIDILSKIENTYNMSNIKDRKNIYLQYRDIFNNYILHTIKIDKIMSAALFIFLNKTCFNGLYRVNRSGLFNVPIGSYKNPCICDRENIYSVSKILKNVEIINADYRESIKFIDKNTFVYIDPPYRPISSTSFVAYTGYTFGDKEQCELADFINKIKEQGAYVLVSNSDPTNYVEDDTFFDDLYREYRIERITATRMINSNALGRGNVRELLISSY